MVAITEISVLTPLAFERFLNAQNIPFSAVGSFVTNSPTPDPREGSDYDYLISAANASDQTLIEWGFDRESPEAYDDQDSNFVSWRRDKINVLQSLDEKWHAGFLFATEVCRRLNLLDKPKRKCLFQAILYGNLWDPTKEELAHE